MRRWRSLAFSSLIVSEDQVKSCLLLFFEFPGIILIVLVSGGRKLGTETTHRSKKRPLLAFRISLKIAQDLLSSNNHHLQFRDRGKATPESISRFVNRLVYISLVSLAVLADISK